MATIKKQSEAAVNNNSGSSLFTKDNYIWMLIGIAVMALGFILL